MSYFRISDYFGDLNPRISAWERREAWRIRQEINSFRTIGEQARYIRARRRVIRNLIFDERIFGIPRNSVLDRLYSESDPTYNKHWDPSAPQVDLEEYEKSVASGGYQASGGFVKSLSNWASYHNFSGLSKGISLLSSKGFLYGFLIALICFVLLNAALFVTGFVNSIGATPFALCVGGVDVSNYVAVSKFKDGKYLPVDYRLAEISGIQYTGKNYRGDVDNRGYGKFRLETFDYDNIWTTEYDEDGNPVRTYISWYFTDNTYALTARWEYMTYHVTEDGNYVDLEQPFEDVDAEYVNWVLQQKVLIRNPKNDSGVVAIVGNGSNRTYWEENTDLDFIGGISRLAARELKLRTDATGEALVNYDGSEARLEFWFVPQDVPVGPLANDVLVSNKCVNTNVGIGNASIADAAVSLAHENIAVATPDTGPNGGNGTDVYVKIKDQIFPGDPYYQSCDRAAATAIRWAGADDTFPAGNTGVQLIYLFNSDKWQYVPARSESDLMPGDILIMDGHVIIYTGNEAIRKKFPNAPSDYVVVHGSIGSRDNPFENDSNRGPAAGPLYGVTFVENGGDYYVFRNVAPEVESVYKHLTP